MLLSRYSCHMFRPRNSCIKTEYSSVVGRRATQPHRIQRELAMFVQSNSSIRSSMAFVPNRQPPPRLKCALSSKLNIKPRIQKVNSTQLANKASSVASDVLKMSLPDRHCGLKQTLESTFEKDIVRLIQLSKKIQRSCSENSSVRSAAAVVASATVENRSCVASSRVQPAQNIRSGQSDTHAHSTSPFDQQTALLGEAPSIFDDQQMREYGTKLVNALFQNPMFSNREATTAKMVVVKKLSKSAPKYQATKPVAPSNRGAKRGQSTSPPRAIFINDRSKEILKMMGRKGQIVRAHSCVESNSCHSPRASGSARAKHPIIKLIRSGSVLPRLNTNSENANSPREGSRSYAGAVESPQMRTWHQMLSDSVTNGKVRAESGRKQNSKHEIDKGELGKEETDINLR